MHPPQVAFPGQPATRPTAPPASRGRYRLDSLHDMGGTTQLWHAHDEELDREVTLAELRPEAAGDAAAAAALVERARVVGQLEHPAIAPVYELSGGPAPFFTSRLVEGRTLSEACREYHDSRAAGRATAAEFRELLRAVLAACNAVAYAHAHGVVHGCLRGSAVVLGEFGEVVVTRWDRARPRAAPPETDKDGDHGGPAPGPDDSMVVPAAADERDDVRALGALLYEVLTGRSAFQEPGADEPRADRDPPRPRELLRRTPPVLEAICLKALAADPAKRHACAADLAQELRTFLADAPVAGYRDSWSARAGRWARRHGPTVAAGFTLLLAVVLGLAAAASVLAVDLRREHAVRLKVQESHDLSERHLARARGRFRMSWEAVDGFHAGVGESPELRSPGLEALRGKLLRSAIRFYEGFVAQEGDDRDAQAEQARALWRLGSLYADTGRIGDAERTYKRALLAQEALAGMHSWNPVHVLDNARTRTQLGELLQRDHRPDEAKNHLGRAKDQMEDLQKKYPEEPPVQHTLAQTYRALGQADPAARKDAWEKALAIERKLARDNPGSAGYERLWATLANDLGMYHLGRAERQPAERLLAEGLLKEALEVQRKLAQPEVPEDSDFLADVCRNLATLYRQTGRPADAERMLRDAAGLCEELSRTHPLVPDYQEHAAAAYGQLADLHLGAGNSGAAVADCQQELALLHGLVAAYPERAADQEQMLRDCDRLCGLYLAAGRTAEAEAAWRAGLDTQAKATAAQPRPGLGLLLQYYDRLAGLKSGPDKAAAREALRKAAVEAAERVAGRRPSAYTLEQLARADLSLAEQYRETGQVGNMTSWLRTARANCQRALKMPEGKEDAGLHALHGRCCAELGEWKWAADDLDWAVKKQPDNAAWREELATVYLAKLDEEKYRQTCADALGWLDKNKNRDPASVRPLVRVFEASPDALPEAARPLELAKDALPTTGEDRGLHAGALYRAGKYKEVVDLLSGANKPTRTRDWIFLAMAQHQLSNAREATRSLEEADRRTKDHPGSWVEQAQDKALRSEAEKMLK
jgi:hypothetical protein